MYRYSQAGTPIVKVKSSYDPEARTFSLKFRYKCSKSIIFVLLVLLLTNVLTGIFSQEVPPTPGQPIKEPMFIPVALGLLNSTGKDMPLSSVYHDGKLESIASNNEPIYSTVLRVTKVRT